jgi:N-acetylglutamate synthase-like GNAT family acetyltransferase
MLTIRRSVAADRDAVFRILKEQDLDYSGLTFDNFWVAEEEGSIVSVARLEEFPDFFFLSSVGTARDKQGGGAATRLLDHILKECAKDVYLYTLIPGFFKALGFEFSPVLCGLPVREVFDCEDCRPRDCVCMKRKAGGPART